MSKIIPHIFEDEWASVTGQISCDFIYDKCINGIFKDTSDNKIEILERDLP